MISSCDKPPFWQLTSKIHDQRSSEKDNPRDKLKCIIPYHRERAFLCKNDMGGATNDLSQSEIILNV
jgi:hypothetical protein